MLITCEKCQAVYSITQKVIGENGRMVKCAKCSHVWKVKPKNIIEPITNNSFAYENRNANNITQEKQKYNKCNLNIENKILKLISILLLISIILVSLINFHNFFSKFTPINSIYEKFGIYNNQGLELKNFSYKIIDESLIITGNLINKSGIPKTIPNIRYIILDYQRKIIFNAIAKFSTKIIEVDQTIPIYAKIANLSEQAAFLQLDLANKIELPIDNN